MFFSKNMESSISLRFFCLEQACFFQNHFFQKMISTKTGQKLHSNFHATKVVHVFLTFHESWSLHDFFLPCLMLFSWPSSWFFCFSCIFSFYVFDHVKLTRLIKNALELLKSKLVKFFFKLKSAALFCFSFLQKSRKAWTFVFVITMSLVATEDFMNFQFKLWKIWSVLWKSAKANVQSKSVCNQFIFLTNCFLLYSFTLSLLINRH